MKLNSSYKINKMNNCLIKNVNKFDTLIKSFHSQTGVPMILNTSLNVNEPICESPENALEVFLKTSMDVLVLQNWILTKKDV